jgi:hypothetical protein
MAAKSGSFRKSFCWSARKEEAARLLAEDELTSIEIAAQVKVSDRQLRTWKRIAEFAERVRALVREIGDAAKKFAIAKRMRRLRGLDARWQKLQGIITERSIDPRMENIPGGRTGLLVIEKSEVRMVPQPDGTQQAIDIPTEVAVDVGLLKELRETEKHATLELRQWVEQQDVTNSGRPLGITLVEVVRTAFVSMQDVEPDDERPAGGDETTGG